MSPGPDCIQLSDPYRHITEGRYWQDLWRKKRLSRLATPGFADPGTYWNDRKNVVGIYAQSRSRSSWQGKRTARLAAMQLAAGSRVLDIGGGNGTLAIPLAEQGCDVTVVEPSAAMRDELGKNAASAGIDRMTVVPARWEDVDPAGLGGPFDAVIASYSLAMPDIGDALMKMQACSRGSVHLFWFLTPPLWAQVSRDLWPRLHGAEYPGEPLADILWQVLFEIGIFANLATEKKPPRIYRDADEAAGEYFQRLNCSTASHRTILVQYFNENLKPCPGGFRLGSDSWSAHLWWDAMPR